MVCGHISIAPKSYSEAKAAGPLAASGNEYDIMSFYMGNCAQYVVYTLLLAAAGLILQRKSPTANVPAVSNPTVKKNQNDDELDELFNLAEDDDNEQAKSDSTFE